MLDTAEALCLTAVPERVEGSCAAAVLADHIAETELLLMSRS